MTKILVIVQSTIEVIGDPQKQNSNTRSDYFVRVYVDKKDVAKSEKMPGVPALQWEEVEPSSDVEPDIPDQC
jgi:hypothetical protein